MRPCDLFSINDKIKHLSPKYAGKIFVLNNKLLLILLPQQAS